MVDICDIEVGDIIKIADNLKGVTGVVPEMLKYQGTLATVVSKSRLSVRIKEDNNLWCWYGHLIDAVMPDDDIDIASPEELSDFLTSS